MDYASLRRNGILSEGREKERTDHAESNVPIKPRERKKLQQLLRMDVIIIHQMFCLDVNQI